MDTAIAAPDAHHRVDQSYHLPNAIDLSHHLSTLSRNRAPNMLKSMYKYATLPGMITLAGGTPSPDYFPYETISASIQAVDSLPLHPPRVPSKEKKSLFSWLFPSAKATTSFTIPKYVQGADLNIIQLSTSLQYQAVTGPPPLALFLRKYVQKIYQPAYADWDVLINCGATDAWAKICLMLLEPGDAILVEEWTYPGAENAFLPMDVEMIPLTLDGNGIIPEYMDKVLGDWDEGKRGKKRPKVLYTIPTGQNPTGSTMTAERKKQIYEICCKYDVIICEDEPYYCLFSGKWTPQSHKSQTSIVAQRQVDAEKKEGKEGEEAFIQSLPPSFLRFDTQGRVIRMDTVSKTACPGSRLGWFTSSPLFIERLTRAAEGSSGAVSGFATALTTTMLLNWGFSGYIRWLRGLKATYRMRRNWLCDTFEDVFDLEFDEAVNEIGSNLAVKEVFGGSGRGVTCYAKQITGSKADQWDEKRGIKSKRSPALVSFIPPTAGMFVFLAVHISEHPDYDALVRKGEDATEKLMDKLWTDCAEDLVLFAPGKIFDAHGVHEIGGRGIGYFRLSYSLASYDQLRLGIETFAKVLTRFYRL